MPIGHQDYRINDSRSVCVSGVINQDLIDRLTPQINRLRAENPAPLTIYIDSPGGSTRLGGVLASLLRCPCQSRRSPKLITVVTGYAGSAAADLLASGDYAIAYPEATVHYHGTRQYFEQGITVEAAQSIADDLQQANELFAIRLAERSIERFTFLFLCERGKFPAYRKEFDLAEDVPEAQVFARVLWTKISGRLRSLTRQAMQDFDEATALSRHIFKRLKVKDRAWGQVEADMFRYILSYELRRNRGTPWSLSDRGLAKVVNDFVMFNDFNFGAQREFLKKFVKGRWKMFVSDAEREKIEAEVKGQPGGEAQLLDRMERRMEPLWHFVYALCKRLQQSENTLSAQDAYWLGIVDEVLGNELPCVRELVENAPQLEQPTLPSQPP